MILQWLYDVLPWLESRASMERRIARMEAQNRQDEAWAMASVAARNRTIRALRCRMHGRPELYAGDAQS
jgi:hypothetical protein